MKGAETASETLDYKAVLTQLIAREDSTAFHFIAFQISNLLYPVGENSSVINQHRCGRLHSYKEPISCPLYSSSNGTALRYRVR
jgi:hypothetical protein